MLGVRNMVYTFPPSLFSLRILLYLFVCSRVCVFGLITFNADIKPKDALVFVGESLEVTCTTKTNVSIEEVYFNIDSGRLSWRVPRESHVIQNNRTVSATINITEAFTSHYTTVECRDGDNELLRSTFILVERPIRNITNFSAYYLYEDHYNISWSLGQRYMAPGDIGVDVGWNRTFLENKLRSELSNCTKSSNETCIINYREVSAFEQIYFIYVRVSVYIIKSRNRPSLDNFTPIFSTSATSEHRIYIYNSTKSGPPVNLTVDGDSSNSTCVGVTWADPVYLKNSYYEGAVFYYNLKYAPANNQDSYVMDTGQYNRKSLPITICSLRPYTLYSLSVQVRREAKQPWSDWSVLTTQTDEDVPLTGPPTMSTSFYSTDCFEGSRDVYVFWLKPDISTLQGQLARFEIYIESGAYHHHYNVSKTSSYSKLPTLACKQGYNVSIYSATIVGRSLVPSLVSIPPANKDLTTDWLDMKVEEIQSTTLATSPKTLSITWKAFNQGGATLVFYRCAKNNDLAFCPDGYTYTDADASAGHLYLYNVTIKEDLIGYALRLASGQTNGIRMTKCVYNRKAKPGKPLGLHVTTLEDYGSLAIAWDADPCNRQTKVLVAYYTIYVCAESTLTSIDSCLQHNVSNTTGSWKVRALEDDRNYNVSIRATSAFNLPGDLSDFKVGRTAFKISGYIILALVFATVGSIVILGCTIWIIKKCNKSRKKFIFYSDVFHQDALMEVKDIKADLSCIDLNESGIGPDISADSVKDDHEGDVKVLSPTECVTLTEDVGANCPTSDSAPSDKGGAPPASYTRLTCGFDHEAGVTLGVNALMSTSAKSIVDVPNVVDAFVVKGNERSFGNETPPLYKSINEQPGEGYVQTEQTLKGESGFDELNNPVVLHDVREYVAFGVAGGLDASGSSTNNTFSGRVESLADIENVAADVEADTVNSLGLFVGESVQVGTAGLSDLESRSLCQEKHLNPTDSLTIPESCELSEKPCVSGNLCDLSVITSQYVTSLVPCKDNSFPPEQSVTDCNHGNKDGTYVSALDCVESLLNDNEIVTSIRDPKLVSKQLESIPYELTNDSSLRETNYVCSGDYLYTVRRSDSSCDSTSCSGDSNISKGANQSTSANSGYLPLDSMC